MNAIKELKEQVYEANLELNQRGLVLYTFGNVSGIDRHQELVAIKPSGVPYSELRVSDIVVVDLHNRVIEGHLRPSSDTKTHTLLYRNFSQIGGVVHSHSTYATAWAQAKNPIPCYGTTHADYCFGEVPCTAVMSDEQVEKDYEEETGNQILVTMKGKQPLEFPMILVASHAPFTWGKDAAQAVYHAVILEELAKMAYLTRTIDPETSPLKPSLLNKHYQRKHGKHAYYGQN